MTNNEITILRQPDWMNSQTISAFHHQVFSESEGAEEGATIGELVAELLSPDASWEKRSLVALQRERLIGSVIFTPVCITTIDHSPSVYIMAPLAIATDYQGQGIGGMLINAGFKMLKSEGVAVVLVLGDPDYYAQFGFHARHQLKAPYPLPYPEAWMARELGDNHLAEIAGEVKCVPPLNAPEHW